MPLFVSLFEPQFLAVNRIEQFEKHKHRSVILRRAPHVSSDLEGNTVLTESWFWSAGKLVKDLSHLAVCFGRPKRDTISIEIHHGERKAIAALRTVRTIINNLIIGVTKGFKYKMRYVYAHFPINVNIEKNKETGVTELEIRYARFTPFYFFKAVLGVS